MNYKKNNSEKGFTFVEMILYVAIVVIVVDSLIPFAWNMIETGVKSSVQQEVSSNARFVAERIKYEIRNAKDINTGSSTFGTNPGTLSLVDFSAGSDPTIINISGGKVMVKQGAAGAVALNSNDTTITNLVFTNNSSANTKNISFTFTLQSNYATTRQEYSGNIVIQSSAEVRSF